MEFGEVVRRRRMVRNYTDDPVDGDALDRILDRTGKDFAIREVLGTVTTDPLASFDAHFQVGVG